MPSPVTPNEFKNLIPDESSNLCQKFLAFLDFPRLFYNWFVSVYNEDGTFTDDYIADICAIDCFASTGGGPGPTPEPGGLQPPANVQATDGDYTNKVRVTWSSVNEADTYDVYRGLSNSFSQSAIIGTVAGTLFDDSTAEANTTYTYWVIAKNTTDNKQSLASQPDTGFISGTITAVTDLRASRGMGRRTVIPASIQGLPSTSGNYIVLTFSPVTGATHYDVYRAPVNDFNSATKVRIGTERQPFNRDHTLSHRPPGDNSKPLFFEQGDHLAYYDVVPTGGQSWVTHYYWVVAKTKVGGSIVAVSDESTALGGSPQDGATGWAEGDGSGVQPVGILHIGSGESWTVPSGITRAWIYFHGHGGSGGGGNATGGGGAGGGAASVYGEVALAATDVIDMITTPDTLPPTSAHDTDGEDGRVSDLRHDPLGVGSPVVFATCNGGKKGLSATNGGTGGAGATGSKTAFITSSEVINGRAGENGSTTEGGVQGCREFGARQPGAHAFGFEISAWQGEGGGGNGGGGSYPNPIAVATGGAVINKGSCTICYYT